MQRRNVLSALRSRYARPLAAAAAALGLAVLPIASSPTSAAAAEAAAGFTVFTNERGANPPGMPQYGAIKSTVVYDVFAFKCNTSGCTANGGAIPTQAVYEAKVKEYMGANQFGGAATAPVVLDFEDIELTQVPTGQAATNAYNLWRQLIEWAHNAAPQAPICNYGYEGWSNQNHDLVKLLHQDTDGNDKNNLDCFAPRMYWDSGETQTSWSNELNLAVSRDRAMADQPIYPYINPKQLGTGGDYLPGNTWSYMIAQLKAKTDGFVNWEPSATTASACAWVSQNSYEMGVITGTSNSGPFTVSATLPSGNCTVQRGTTTTVPVTLTNNTSSTTAATQMQSFADTPGFSGSWKYWNLPALAPGASFSTELPMTIAATQSTSTALLHIKTGLSDNRWAVIVQ
ncbi:hypothetical protein AB0C51_21370 [Streptomyces pathocidini]|uniref:hypothetical protein n=1 Tax=Streptomyces pathocidini TaxID=1650571 RepID=UPI0033D7EC99